MWIDMLIVRPWYIKKYIFIFYFFEMSVLASIIWHLSNNCVRRQQWRLSSGGGARCLIMSIKLGHIRPPIKNIANQVRTTCSTRRRKARLVRLRRGNAATIKNGNSSWERPVQGESGNVLCEVCLSHFSISHGDEYDVKRHKQCGTHKKRYYFI